MTQETTDNITEDFSVKILKTLLDHSVTIPDTVAHLASLMNNRLEKGILDVLATKDHKLWQIRHNEEGNGQVALVRSDTLDKVVEFMKKTYIKTEYHIQLDEFGDDQFGGISLSIHLCENLDKNDDDRCDNRGVHDSDICENWETISYTYSEVEHWMEDDCKYEVMGMMLQAVNAYHDLTTQEIE